EDKIRSAQAKRDPPKMPLGVRRMADGPYAVKITQFTPDESIQHTLVVETDGCLIGISVQLNGRHRREFFSVLGLEEHHPRGTVSLFRPDLVINGVTCFSVPGDPPQPIAPGTDAIRK